MKTQNPIPILLKHTRKREKLEKKNPVQRQDSVHYAVCCCLCFLFALLIHSKILDINRSIATNAQETKRKISHIAKNVRTSNAQCSWRASTAQRKSRHQAKFRRKNLILFACAYLLLCSFVFLLLLLLLLLLPFHLSVSVYPSSTLIYYPIELCGTAAHFSLILNRFATLFEFLIYLFLATMKHFHLNEMAFETQATKRPQIK